MTDAQTTASDREFSVVLQLGRLVSDDPDEEKRQKEFKSFLNKITPDNYETIRDKIIAVGMQSPATLQGLIDQVLLSFILCLWLSQSTVSVLKAPSITFRTSTEGEARLCDAGV